MKKEAPRCGAKTQKGNSCRNRAMANGRCWLHGGKDAAAEPSAPAPPLVLSAPDVPAPAEPGETVEPTPQTGEEIDVAELEAALSADETEAPPSGQEDPMELELDLSFDEEDGAVDLDMELGMAIDGDAESAETDGILDVSDLVEMLDPENAAGQTREDGEGDTEGINLDVDEALLASLEEDPGDSDFELGMAVDPEPSDGEAAGGEAADSYDREADEPVNEPDTDTADAVFRKTAELDLAELEHMMTGGAAQDSDTDASPADSEASDSPEPVEIDIDPADFELVPEIEDAAEGAEIIETPLVELKIEDLDLVDSGPDEDTGSRGPDPADDPPEQDLADLHPADQRGEGETHEDPLSLGEAGHPAPTDTGTDPDGGIDEPSMDLDMALEMDTVPEDRDASGMEDLTLELEMDPAADDESCPTAPSEETPEADALVADLEMEMDLEMEAVEGADAVSDTEPQTPEPPLSQADARNELFDTQELSTIEETMMVEPEAHWLDIDTIADEKEAGAEDAKAPAEASPASGGGGTAVPAKPVVRALGDTWELKPERSRRIQAVPAVPDQRKATGMPPPPFLKRRIHVSVGGVIVAAILALVMVAGWQFYRKEGATDAGIRQIRVLQVEGRVVEAGGSGPLFVITGRAQNDSDHERRAIRIAGKLFVRGDFSKTETVYCGTVLSDSDLAGATLQEIKVQTGDANAGVKVGPGGTLPFMVVFFDLPADLNLLDRYTVEVLGSIPL